MDIINNFIGMPLSPETIPKGEVSPIRRNYGRSCWNQRRSFLINAALIEKIEFIPETKITLTTGKYYLVKDSKEEIVNKIITFNQIIKGVTAVE